MGSDSDLMAGAGVEFGDKDSRRKSPGGGKMDQNSSLEGLLKDHFQLKNQGVLGSGLPPVGPCRCMDRKVLIPWG